MKFLIGLLICWVFGESAFAQDLSAERRYVAKQDEAMRAFEHSVTFLSDLSPTELSKLNADTGKADNFVKRYVPAGLKNPDLLENLDRATEAYFRDNQPNKQSKEEVVDMVGAAYGQYCIEHLKVKWARLSSHYGDGIGLCREIPFTGIFPFPEIRSKVEDRKSLSLRDQYAEFESYLKDNPNGTFDEAAHQKYCADYHHLWEELGKITLPGFKFQGATRTQMVRHLNEAIHNAHPDTSIRIVFIPPDASEHVDESRYPKLSELDAKSTPVSSLLDLLGDSDIKWYVRGTEVIGTHRSD